MRTPSTRRRGRAGSLPRSRRSHRPAHRFAHSRRLRLEPLERRLLLSTFTVTSPSDSGPGSLRQAILDANADAVSDIIDFNIAGPGPHTIQPTSALPTITNPVTLDATTQPGFAGTPIIELDGSLAGTDGVTITADNCTVRGLVINRFSGSGIVLDGGSHNALEGNFVGTDVTGTVALANGGNGIEILNGAEWNRIGTDGDGVADTAERNLISGNAHRGCFIRGGGSSSASHNVVAGNFIGTDVSGTFALGNGYSGVNIGRSPSNRIGTDGDGVADAAERNLISANARNGVHIWGSNTTDNVVAGNFLGTDVTGAAALGNGRDGVRIADSAESNLVGTDGDGVADADERNVISGNVRYGLQIVNDADHNVVAGNFIGTDLTGTGTLGNGRHGMYIALDASSNRIGANGDDVADAAERNIISANGESGVQLVGKIDYGVKYNVVAGNFIGTDVTGTAALGNAEYGVWIAVGSRFNLIGADGNGIADAAERNVISGNGQGGVYLSGGSKPTRDNVVAGNFIGTDVTGSVALQNQGAGVSIYHTGYNRIGTDGNGVGDASEGNVISGNRDDGVSIEGSFNVVAGNYIGTDASGATALGNGLHGVSIAESVQPNRIGTDGDGVADEAERNVISANGASGVRIWGEGAWGNVVAGNSIGTDVTGTVALGNGAYGVKIEDGAQANLIGTDGDGVADEAERNVISGNMDHGVYILGAGTDQNVVAGNHVGTDATGTVALGNGVHGVCVAGGAQSNLIGTDANGVADEAERNVVSGNLWTGVAVLEEGTNENRVAGNFIGTDVTGTVALGNARDGVKIWWASNQRIGGANPGEGNLISGNDRFGVFIQGDTASDNLVQGNYIGTDLSGSEALGNGEQGVLIEDGADGNVIGTDGDGLADEVERNVISANALNGVHIEDEGTDFNVVAGNYIGTDGTGTVALGNGKYGVRIEKGAQANLVGTDGDGVADAAERNVISGNTLDGVHITGEGTDSNVVAGNYIGADATGAAALGNGRFGVTIVDGAGSNRIGADGDGVADSAERNVISANASHGVMIKGVGTDSNVVAGNYIGTDVSGTAALGNGFGVQSGYGVVIHSGAQSNRIGTNGDGLADAAERNVISANSIHGLVIEDSGSDHNVVAGNYVGTDASGTVALGNGAAGVLIQNNGEGGPRANLVGTDADGVADEAERNVISANGHFGLAITGAGADDNVVAGNCIGTDASGTAALENGFSVDWGYGLGIVGRAQRNRIGTNGHGIADDAERNVISGNTLDGVRITGEGTDFNVIAGNFIGTDLTGTVALPNAGRGVRIQNGARSNRIGTDGNGAADAAERNIISGNLNVGVSIAHAGTSDNVVAGNFIGTDVTGTVDLGNRYDGVNVSGAPNQRIGGTNPGEGNLISGNNHKGVILYGASATGNRVEGNFIGTDISGTSAIPNGGDGVKLLDAPHNTVGGLDLAARNLISGNGYEGVRIAGTESVENVVLGNYIGTDLTGTAPLPNSQNGVLIFSGASGNTVGGAVAEARNVISANRGHGVAVMKGLGQGNQILGNYIGVDATGLNPLGNQQSGVYIEDSANNTVGGMAPGAGNLISANLLHGVQIVETDVPVFHWAAADGGNGHYYVLAPYSRWFTAEAGAVMAGGHLASITSQEEQDFINTSILGDDAFGNEAFWIGGTDRGSEGTFAWTSGEPFGFTNWRPGQPDDPDYQDYVAINLDPASKGTWFDYSEWYRLRGIIELDAAPDPALLESLFGADNNVMAGNCIGTDATGTTPLGNGGDGVRILPGAQGNRIGVGEVFCEIGGRVVVEAEHFSARRSGFGRGWRVVPDEGPGDPAHANARGAGYIQALPNGGPRSDDPLADPGPSVDYRIQIDTPGDYQLYVRWDGHDYGSDSFYGRVVELDDGPGGSVADWYRWSPYDRPVDADFATDPWVGTAAFETPMGGDEVPAVWSITTPGLYTLRFIMRESGTAIDTFTLQLATLPAPTGDGPEESSVTMDDAAVFGNTIAFNAQAGVAVAAGDTVGNRIQGNTIYANGALGIDLGAEGVTPNDAADPDVGANMLQNYPVIDVVAVGASTRVAGSLDSIPNTEFTLDFYANTFPDPSGYGEGERWLGSMVVTTDAAGDAAFDLLLPAATTAGEMVAATATDPEGNTSEFSAAQISGPGGEYRDVVLLDEPFAYYRLGEGPGAITAVDETGAHDGTYQNDPTLGVPGPILTDPDDTAAEFDETQYVEGTPMDDYASRLIEGFTIEYWARFSEHPDQCILGSANPGYNTNLQLTVYPDDGSMRLYFRDDDWDRYSVWIHFGGDNADVFDGAWHHMVHTYDPTPADPADRFVFYIDSVPQVLDVQPGNDRPDGTTDFVYPMIIGGWHRRGTIVPTFAGGLDEVAFYTRPLAPQEVAEHYGAATNFAPVAVDDADYRVEANSVLAHTPEGGVLGNDWDIDGDALAAVLVDRPLHGTVALEADGSFRYAPEAGFDGVDTFTYLANDGSSDSNVATVTITVEAGPLPEPVPFYFALETRGTVGGLNVQVEDIMLFDGARFRRFFDGSDVGVRRLSIDAVAVVSENEILMSFATAAAVPGIAGTVEPSDLVKFTATRLGPTTAGAFEFYFDGSDVGLSGAAENVDGVEMLEDGRLVFSTTGEFEASGVTGAGEDLLLFTPTSLGSDTAGTWELYFDGSDVGLDGGSVDAVAMDDTDLLLSSGDTFSAPPLTADDEDVFLFLPTSLGPDTDGSYAAELYFDGSQHGLDVNDLVAVDLAPDGRPVAVEEDYQVGVNRVLDVVVGEGVLVNDSDPDGHSLAAIVVDGPTHGTLILGVDGSFTYTPDTGYEGPDQFSYRANDGRLASNAATVTIDVWPPNPHGLFAMEQYLTEDWPYGVAAGDVDGDGLLDLVHVGGIDGSGRVSIRLGDGEGRFGESTTYQIDPDPSCVALGDLNDDGALDIVASTQQGVASVLLGDGTGAFAGHVSYPVGADAVSVALGDLDGNATLDVVTTNQGDDTVSVLLGHGDGTFADQTTYDVGDEPSSVALGDLNGDGTLDAVVTNEADGTVSLLRGSSDGTFAAQTTLGAEAQPISVALGDLNDDGALDIVVGNHWGANASVWLGHGDGTFAGRTDHSTSYDLMTHVALGDMNGDGMLDIVTSDLRFGDVRVQLGNGDGSFADPVAYGTGNHPVSLALGDFNVDGALDMATANRLGNSLWVYLGHGDGILAPQASDFGVPSNRSVTLGDVNVDGVLDAVIACGGRTLAVAMGNGDGTFRDPTEYRTGNRLTDVILADLNGDGALDIIAHTYLDSSVSVLLGHADGTFADYVNYDVGQCPRMVTIEDLDGDGALDLVCAPAHYADHVAVRLGNGDGTFADLATYPVGTYPWALVVDDLNGDGCHDIVTANGSDTVSVLLNNGNGTFSDQATYDVGNVWTDAAMALGDVNGDGHPDIVVLNQGDDTMSVLLGVGDGAFAEQVTCDAGDKPLLLSLIDLNDDGKLDAVTTNGTYPSLGTVSIRLGRGDGTFGDATSYPIGSFVSQMFFTDLDDDGALDIVSTTHGSAVAALLGRGDGTFVDATIYSIGTWPVEMSLGDLNGDSLPDVVTAHAWNDDISVLLNQLRGLWHSPRAEMPGSVDGVRFHFFQEMDVSSFSPADDLVSFVGPAGALAVSGFSWVDDCTLDVTFEPQYATGEYQMIIGPGILDAYGHAMNVDHDWVEGETLDDRYVATFTVIGARTLGPIGSVEVAHLNPAAGNLWYQFETTRDAVLSLQATFAPADGDVQLTLYDENLTELATSTLIRGNQRIDRPASPGESYYVKLSGTNGDVDLRLANLVSHVGTEVTVYGTDGADWFEFDPAASRVVTINGIEYRFEDAEVTWAIFHGGDGDDVALLYGDPNGSNRFESWPGEAKLSGDDSTVQVTSVRYVHAYGNRGPLDVALLHGDPNGPNRFEAWPHQSKLRGDDSFACAHAFRYVHAFANRGAADVALLHGDPNGPNRFEAWPDEAKLRGDDSFARAKAFRYVHAYGNQGPTDVALLHGDPNGPNRFEAWPDEAKLQGDEYFARAKSFRYVHTYAYRSGDDEAVLHDSALTDYLDAADDWVTLRDAAFSFFYRASGYDTVKAYSTTPSGDVKRVAAIDYILDLSEYYWEEP